MRLHHTQRRDSSLRKLSIINRWLLAASVTLTAILTDIAAHAFPSKASTRRSVGSGKTPTQPHHRASHSAKHASSKAPNSLSPPDEAPRAAPESPTSPESAPSQESTETPARQQGVPASEAAENKPEPAPAREAAPSEEAPAPVVSGGS
jgi:hypothetical protein